MSGWVRWLEHRGLYAPGERASTRTDWRNITALAVIWLVGAALLLVLIAVAG